MSEKPKKIGLPKYSSYLTDNDSELLELFCNQFDCSKAKALPLLLKFWIENKDNVSYQLATISNEDLTAKKYDDRLATIEEKLANLGYDSELANIKLQLATIEEKLANLSNNPELAIISSELANNDSNELDNVSPKIDSDDLGLVGVSQVESNLVSEIIGAIELTKNNALSESSILPLKEDLGEIVPNKKNKGKKTNKEKLTDYLNSIKKGEKVEGKKAEIAEKLGFSRNVISTKAQCLDLWNESFKDVNGDGTVWEKLTDPLTP